MTEKYASSHLPVFRSFKSAVKQLLDERQIIEKLHLAKEAAGYELSYRLPANLEM